MNRNEIEAVVFRHLRRAVVALEELPIDTSRSMKELGANSLDIVEVVSGSMRELRIRIPRSDLETLTNVDALVDMLLARASEKA